MDSEDVKIKMNRIQRMEKWELRFLHMAAVASKWSKDPRTRVGAAIRRHDNTMVTVGYNGLAPGVDDEHVNDRTFKNLCVLHAEENAVLTARTDLMSSAIYVWGLTPCAHCASVLARSGIVRCVAVQTYENSPSWVESQNVAQTVLEEAGVEFEFFGSEVVDYLKNLFNEEESGI